jgi:nucleoside-diphosphate-sugar epimerase
MSGTVVLTGATGFVGGHVFELLASLGMPLRVLVRKDPQRFERANVETITGSLEDPSALQRLLTGATTLVHLAGAIAARSRAEFFATNAEGTRRLADAAATAGIAKFILISSLAAREPLLSDYGASKRAGEEAVNAHRNDFEAAILRPPVVYGPGDRSSLPLLAQLTRRFAIIPGSPEARFSLLHVRDLAQMIALALRERLPGVEEISDGTENGYSWPELIAVASRSEGRKVTPLYLPRSLTMGLSIPIAAAAKLMGSTPFFSPDKVKQLYHRDWVSRGGQLQLPSPLRFDSGFSSTVAWYRQQGWLPPRGAREARPVKKGELLS